MTSLIGKLSEMLFNIIINKITYSLMTRLYKIL